MNRLLECWREFSPKFSVIFETYVNNLWTKVIAGSVIFLLIVLDVIPQWIQALAVLIVITMVWSFLTGKKTVYEPAKRQFSVTTTSSNSLDNNNSINNFSNSRNNESHPDRVISKGNGIHSEEVGGGGGGREQDYEDSTSTSVTERLNHTSLKTKEPLDPITWSAVTSPGFTTRLAQKKGGNPLRESNNSSSFSPLLNSSLTKSPLRSNGVTSPYKPSPKLQPPTFQSPVNAGRYSVTKKKKQVPFGTTYVHVAPVDVINQTLPVSKAVNGPGPTIIERGGVSYGLGGYSNSPSGSLNTRMQKLWSPPMMDSPIPYDAARPSSVGPPMSQHGMTQCTISDQNINRKRNRLPDGMIDRRSSPIRAGSPGYVQDELAKQNSKRTKYIQSSNDLRFSPIGANRNLPYVTLPSMQVNDESMTSESILEQMNQTEKRFLPDDDHLAPRSPKKNRPSMGVSKALIGGNSLTPLRKRRTVHAMTNLEEDEESAKNRGFCSCSECYEEAAGLASRSDSLNKSAPKKSKTVSFNCDAHGGDKSNGYISAMTQDKKSNDATEKYTPVPLQIITKSKYEADRQRRLERLNRMLNESFKRSEYKPGSGEATASTATTNSFGFSIGETKLSSEKTLSAAAPEDMVDGLKASSNPLVALTQQAAAVNSASGTEITKTATAPFSFGGTASLATAEDSSASKSQFGQTNSTSFNFGQQGTNSDKDAAEKSLPAAPASTVEISKPGGFTFGAPLSSPPTSVSNGTSSIFAFSGGNSGTTTTVSSTGAGNVSFGSSTSALSTVPTPSTASAPTTSSLFGNNAPSTSSGTLGLSSSSVGASAVTAPPAYGFPGTTTSAPSATVASVPAAASALSFGGQSSSSFAPGTSTNAVSQPVDPAKTSGGFSFGNVQSPSSTPATTASTAFGSAGFSFGNQTQSPAVSSSTNATTTVTSTSLFGQNATPSNVLGSKDSPAPPASLFGAGTVTPSSTATNTSVDTKSSMFTPSVTSGTAASGASTNSSTPAFQFGQGPSQPSSSQATPAPASTSSSQQSSGSSGGFSFSFGQKPTGSETPSTGFGQSQPSSTSFGTPNSTFGNSATTTPSLFGQGNAAASSTTTAGVTTTFGAPSTTAASGFGQTAATAFGQGTATFGQSSTPAFGQGTTGSSVPTFCQNNSGSTVPAFGSQTNQSGSVPAFGHSSSNATPAFGNTSTNGNAFGQPASTFGQSSNGGGFGQTAGASSAAPNVFGNTGNASVGIFGPNATTSTPAFCQKATTNVASPFGQSATSAVSPFGQTPATTNAVSPFGQPSTTNAASPFGQPSAGSTPAFGQGATSPSFGSSATSPFGQPNTSSTFGQPSASSSFSFGGNNSASFGQQPSAFGSSGNQPAPAFGSPVNQSGGAGFGSPPNKPMFGQAASSGNNASFSFGQGQNQPAQSSSGFNFGAAASGSTNNNTAASPFGGSGFNASQPSSPGMFGSVPNNNSNNNPQASGAFNFGQAAQQANQGGFNFAAQAPPAFGQQNQQQQPQMFNMGTTPSSARRRDARSGRRYR